MHGFLEKKRKQNKKRKEEYSNFFLLFVIAHVYAYTFQRSHAEPSRVHIAAYSLRIDHVAFEKRQQQQRCALLFK